MATVYLAHDLKHDRDVALKVLHPELAATLGPERFQREIRTTARLQHPHILPVLDSGESGAQLWYTMPYVEGESLRDRLRREGQLPLDDALQIAREVADALGYAHSQGIVHRDIKPENILLSRGHALVADFGIARAVQIADAEQLTATGVAVGTPAYMSPEQADGASSVDGRSDLYSLGCVFYEMLTGEVPYTGRTPQAVIAKRVLEPLPHVRTVRASVPVTVEQAINRALAVTPADRFATAAEFTRALAQPLTDPGTTNTLAAPQPMAVGRQRRVPRGLATLALGVLLGVGMLLAWLRTRPQAGTAGPKRLAVLPFENLGRPEDEYFTAGLTDAVRGKLTELPGLQVIARTSSSQYKHTSKSPQQIGRELGVEYLLTGTVRWEQEGGGASRVQVSPELVQVSTAAARWQAPFEAPLTDVFQVQGQIAGRVAGALGVALGAGERERFSERPTQNLAAYDAFLQGEAALQTTCRVCRDPDPPSLRRAIASYSEAVALDSAFGSAWARLAYAQATIYPWSAATPAMTRAVERALARAQSLEAGAPPTQLALSVYWQNVRHEPGKALAAAEAGLARAPNDPDLLVQAASQDLILGRAVAGVDRLARAQALDPRDPSAAANLARALLWLRRWPEAALAAQKGLALAPTDVTLVLLRIESVLGRGDLAGARQIIAQAGTRGVEPSRLGAFLAVYDDLYWVLNDAQQRLVLTLPPSAFNGDTATWGLVRAQLYHLRSDPTHAGVYADSARRVFAMQLRRTPGDAESRCLFGLALAYKGLKAAAIREGERGVALSHDGGAALYCQHQLARIYLLVGEPDLALDQLEPLLKVPYYLSPGWLKIDPNFAPLRGNPRFERLVAEK
jgi:eukaryotic-like serine/threonine-protein kinase